MSDRERFWWSDPEQISEQGPINAALQWREEVLGLDLNPVVTARVSNEATTEIKNLLDAGSISLSGSNSAALFNSDLDSPKLVRIELTGGDLASFVAPEGAEIVSRSGGFEKAFESPVELFEIAETEEPSADSEKSEGVYIAIIDDGIAVANQRFRHPDGGTRVEHFLDMNYLTAPPDNLPGTVRWIAKEGVHWKKADIDRIIERCNDDESIYRAMGMWVNSNHRAPLSQQYSHGTHVLDIAAGSEWNAPIGNRPIIAVQLPSEVVEDRSGSRMADALEIAARWIANTASNNPNIQDMVVNFSFGVSAGPHDGSGSVENWLADLQKSYEGDGRRCEVVLAGGNSLQDRCVARWEPSAEPVETLNWRVQPDDRGFSTLEIWTPRAAKQGQRVQVRVAPPDGYPKQSQDSAIGHTITLHDGTDPIARVYHEQIQRPGIGDNGMEWREKITITLRGTSVEVPGPRTPAGLWHVSVKASEFAPEEMMEARIQRNDGAPGMLRRGRQSYFDHPDYEKYDDISGAAINDVQANSSIVTRGHTLSAFATGTRTIAVAGYMGSNEKPVFYSSAGPSSNPARSNTPSVAAVSDNSYVHRGVIASGNYSSTVALMAGTSVSAPAVTRKIADELETNRAKKIAGGSIGTGKGWIEVPTTSGVALSQRLGAARLKQSDVPNHRRRLEQP